MKPVQRVYVALQKLGVPYLEKVWITALDAMPDNPTDAQAIDSMLEAIIQHKQ